MTGTYNWEQQPGGLYLAVSPFDKTNIEHRDAAISVVRKVAQVHGAEFDQSSFHNNMNALYAGDIKIDLFLAKWEVCTPNPICLGASLNWKTVGIDANGQMGRGIYMEDVCILNDKLRQLLKQRPEGKEFPAESLLECFDRLSLRNFINIDGAKFKFGEANPDNTKIIRPLENNGGLFGKGKDSAVLEFKRLPNDLIDRLPMNVEIIPIGKAGIRDDNIFVARWQDGSYDVRFIVTKGQATAIGKPRADIRPWHNGQLPEHDVLDCVIARSLLAIKHEVEERGWSNQSVKCASTFPSSMPDAHIYIFNDQRLVDAFMSVGASLRLFGDKPMKPGVHLLKPEIRLAA